MSCRGYRIEGKQLSAAVVVGLWVSASPAQITLDGSLGPGGPLAGPDFQIPHTVGRTVGPNLFHSFGEFNIYKKVDLNFAIGACSNEP